MKQSTCQQFTDSTLSSQERSLYEPIKCPVCGYRMEPWFGRCVIQYRHCSGIIKIYRTTLETVLTGRFMFIKPELPGHLNRIESALFGSCRWCGKHAPSHFHFYKKTGQCRTVGKSLIRRKKYETYKLWSGIELFETSSDLSEPTKD